MGYSCSTTGAEATSTTCSAWPTCSTRSGGSMSCPHARRFRCRGGPGITGMSSRGWAIRTPTRSEPRIASSAALHDELWERTGVGPDRTVLGGFSMGSVMSYALGLGPDRPAPAGILAFSGFVPTVEGWQPDLATRTGTPVFIAHGRNDPVMNVEFARQARELLEGGGLPVSYHESDAAHQIDPAHLPLAREWIDEALPPSR